MHHYYFKNMGFMRSGFLITEKTLEWLFQKEPSPWAWLPYVAKHRFHREPDYSPPKPPVIDIILSPDINRPECMPDGVVTDFFSFGSFWFVSPRLKALFESFSVQAFYSEANITIEGDLYPEQYWLFVPSLALDAMDREKSVYEEDDDYEIRIQRIKKLVLSPDKIPKDTPLFQLAATVKNIRIMHDDLVEALEEMEVTGMEFWPISEGSWMY